MKSDVPKPPCGLNCSKCEHIGKRCRGCMRLEGKPFWTTMYKVDVCPLYGCCVGKKGFEHCGMCEEFPCKTFTGMRDPSMSDAEFEKSLDARKKELIKRRDGNG